MYALPFHQNIAVRGWQVSGILTLQSGNPFTVSVPGANPIGGGTGVLRANLVGDPTVATPGPNLWFNPAAFAAPASGQPGTSGRNTLIGPGFKNVDFSLSRSFHVTERFGVQFRAEAFDLFNNVNFGQPISSIGSSLSGHILSTRFGPGDSGSSRQLQFGVKVSF